jgi:hypothetical protein
MTRTVLMHLPGLLRAMTPCIALLLGLGVFAGDARAGGFYRVAECSPGHLGTPDARVEGTSSAFAAGTSCAGGNWLQVQSAANAAAGSAKQWTYTAPSGTRIEEFDVDFNLVGDSNPDGNRSFLFIRRSGQAERENLSVVGLGSHSGHFDSTIQDLGPFADVGVGVFCSKSAGNCSYAPDQLARMSKISFLMEDVSPPAAPFVAGAAADGEWVGGTTAVAVGETDVGGGVYRTTVEVNGQQLLGDTICEPGQDVAGYVSSMSPCDQIKLRYLNVDTTAAGFEEGAANEVRVCTHEFGFAAASTCTVEEFKVDNQAPAAPRNLEVAGGQGWHRDNEFDLSWTNPEQENAPISAATVRVTGPNGFEATSTIVGSDITAVDDVTVPSVGAYRAEVFLRDAAGNETRLNSAAVDLKFDDTVPVGSRPEKANGWISRDQLKQGYLQSWRKPSATEIPPSGIAGYRAVVNASGEHDPCAGAEDPRACSGRLTEVGVDNNSRVLDGDDLVEGLNWIHVVPVSGSGMRATEVGRVPLKVDLTNPASRLSGAPNGWVNHPVDVTVSSEDELSGMTDTEEYPDDAPPRTVLEIDGTTTEEPDADVSARVSAEGHHEIRYWARDLAGNENDGVGDNDEPGAATVSIDTTTPQVSFGLRQDPADPDRLEANVFDSLSGVAGGTIGYRRKGDAGWIELPTRLHGARLVARVDSENLDRGVTYEFRAQATDRAGNVTASDRRSDGSAMVTTGPFRAATEIRDLSINGKRQAKVRYGGPIRVRGRLVTAGGGGVGGAPMTLGETFASGSRRPTRSVTAVTDSSGRFTARLKRGPSRTVAARFAGDARRLSTTSSPVRARVRGGVTFKAPKRAKAGRRATFRGRVKAKGARFARSGKSVEIQVRIGRKWKTVGRSLHTDARGRFRLRYRFVANYTRPVRYRFRAVVLRERGWPYLPATSRIRSLSVVP